MGEWRGTSDTPPDAELIASYDKGDESAEMRVPTADRDGQRIESPVFGISSNLSSNVTTNGVSRPYVLVRRPDENRL